MTPIHPSNLQASGAGKIGLTISAVFGCGLVLCTAIPALAQQSAVLPSTVSSNLTGFAAPGAGTGSYQGTVAYAMNAVGAIAGTWWNGSEMPHGFVRAANGTIEVFDAPGAGTAKGEGTVPLGIDAAGDVAGIYVDSNEVAHGFFRSAAGAITGFDAPGAGTGQFLGTFPDAMDAAGDVAGAYADNNSGVHGFFRSAAGTVTTFNAPGTLLGTTALDINASGVITGAYIDQNKVAHSFIRTAAGQITTFEAPGADVQAYSGTVALAIDAGGDVTGVYTDASSLVHGFVRSAAGAFATFEAPGAGTGKGLGTYPIAINAAGEIVGAYTDAKSGVHGFVRAATGQISTFDAPGAGTFPISLKPPAIRPGRTGGHFRRIRRALSGATVYGETAAFSIDAGGNVTGVFLDADAVIHGFVRNTNGLISTFSAPGAGKDKYQGTIPITVNAADAIAGTYIDSNFTEHGYFFNAAALFPTTLALKASPADSGYREPVTFKATVSSSHGTPANGDPIYFMDGKTLLGTEPLNAGVASFTTTGLPEGASSISAVFGGDLTFFGSDSSAVTEQVGKSKSFVTLSAKPNPSTFRQPVVFTASVTGQYGGAPSGKVTFALTFPPSTAELKLGSEPIVNGEAKLTYSTLGVGTGQIVATYSGDSHFDVGISANLKQVVEKAATTTELASSLNPSDKGKTVTLTAPVKGKFGGTPDGSVTFKDGTTTLKTVSLSDAEAKFTTSTLASGEHHLTAVYAGSGYFTGSTGALTQTVN